MEEDEQKYYVVGNQLLEYRIDLKLDLVKSFSEFLRVCERYGNQLVANLITYDISCKTITFNFILFILKQQDMDGGECYHSLLPIVGRSGMLYFYYISEVLLKIKL